MRRIRRDLKRGSRFIVVFTVITEWLIVHGDLRTSQILKFSLLAVWLLRDARVWIRQNVG